MILKECMRDVKVLTCWGQFVFNIVGTLSDNCFIWADNWIMKWSFREVFLTVYFQLYLKKNHLQAMYVFRSRRKKNMTGQRKKRLLSHKSYSNVIRILCISLIMIFNCCPIIHGHRLFFSLLTEIHKCRSFFAKTKPLFKADFNILGWNLKAFRNLFVWKIVCYSSFAPLNMF